ncbi:hypothetical protein C5746_05750 [Streptomyces atratus]|uniref:Uncharacterized protein n=1 Tax=Streptomyces atratus TaxID=1893 RepID=A0A2Z5J9E5_STRAR|nr:hypothetical protein C5746_05750 [Streptomyces atratus]
MKSPDVIVAACFQVPLGAASFFSLWKPSWLTSVYRVTSPSLQRTRRSSAHLLLVVQRPPVMEVACFHRSLGFCSCTSPWRPGPTTGAMHSASWVTWADVAAMDLMSRPGRGAGRPTVSKGSASEYVAARGRNPAEKYGATSYPL